MKGINYYISEKLRIGKDYNSNQRFDTWDEFKEYLESIDIKVTKNSRFWWWLESKEKSIKCIISPSHDNFFFINSRADTNEGIIYINEDGKWVALSANNYKFDMTVDEENKPAFKYSSNTADILKKILSGEFNVTEKLHIGKDFDNTHTDISIKEFLQELDDNDMMLEEIKDAARNEVGRLICLKPNNFPVMRIKLEENYFNSWYLDDKKYVLRVLSNPLDEYESSYEKILDINEYGFRYTRNNAKLLYHILKTEGKVEVTEKLHINKDYKINKKKYFPHNKEELLELVKKLIKENGRSANLNEIDTSEITNMSELFEDMNVQQIDISEWNVSNVTDMHNMFHLNKFFNCDLSNWDVSKVKNMEYMFNGCESFDADLSKWNVSNLEKASCMFSYCYKFDCDLSKWDVSKIFKMEYMFYDCENFSHNLSNWKIKRGCDMYSTFTGCRRMPNNFLAHK